MHEGLELVVELDVDVLRALGRVLVARHVAIHRQPVGAIAHLQRVVVGRAVAAQVVRVGLVLLEAHLERARIAYLHAEVALRHLARVDACRTHAHRSAVVKTRIHRIRRDRSGRILRRAAAGIPSRLRAARHEAVHRLAELLTLLVDVGQAARAHTECEHERTCDAHKKRCDAFAAHATTPNVTTEPHTLHPEDEALALAALPLEILLYLLLRAQHSDVGLKVDRFVEALEKVEERP